MVMTSSLPAARPRILAGAGVLLLVILGGAVWRSRSSDAALVAVVRRGSMTAQLVTTGTLRPIRSLTYRSPLPGREVEILDLAPEGTHINAGDLLVRLDASEAERELDRARQELRQAQLDLEVVNSELEEAQAAVTSASEGDGALTLAETRTRLGLAERKAARLRQEFDQLKPLLQKGFITRDELARTESDLEQADEELTLTRKRVEVAEQLTHPREQRRAALQAAQKQAQRGRASARLQETEVRVTLLQRLVEDCSLYARRAGLVVYEEYLSVNPRRKVRIGDRVTSSQGIVTIPEVTRMMVDASVGEAEVHRVQPGQTATIRVEAFAGQSFSGKVVRVGTLASSSVYRGLDDRRFDLAIDVDPTTADLRPDMTVRADVNVGARTDVLLVPVNAVFEQHGVFVAHVLSGSRTETRTVELGESNDRVVEVLTGLSEGDRVRLAAPGSLTARGASPSSAGTPNALQPR
ncbi:MAG: efflux RND transporter periplasmic adaptor subunit [Vicinamibacterales bacterium]